MAYQTVRDLVEHMKALHDRLRRAARASASGEADPRRALLLRYMEDHELQMKRALTRVQEGTEGSVLATWLQFTPDAEVDAVIGRLEDEPLPDFEDLVARVVEAQEAFVQVYRILQAETSAPRVRAFFASMMEMEEEARKGYARVRQESSED